MHNLKIISSTVRKNLLNIITEAKSSHIGGALSIVEILVVLYHKVLNMEKIKNNDIDRDYFILSKGHCCSAHYSVLETVGVLDKKILYSYYQDGSLLAGHPIRNTTLGIEVSSGSLGHGLPIGCGLAMSSKLSRFNNKIFVLVGDGECNEGSNWEAMMLASKLELGNLTVIIDSNKWQGLERSCAFVSSKSLNARLSAFGFDVTEVDGHNINDLYQTINDDNNTKGQRPRAIIAHTIKGKGVSFMENTLEWHYKSPNPAQYDLAIKELSKDEKSVL